MAADIAVLIKLRCAFLAEVNGADPNNPRLSQALFSYFSSHIPTGDFVAFCGIVDDRIIAASGLVFHHYPPSAKNLVGKQAYIMNMYTVPEWWGRGIGTRLLQELLAVAPPQLSSRFAQGHNYYGYKTAHTDWGALAGGAALRSTANDMLKFVSANLALAPSNLTKLVKKTHVTRFRAGLDANTDVDTDIGLTWMIMHDTDKTTIIGHGGLTRGFTTFVGFDQARHRGVVVLCNSLDLDVSRIGRILLESEWRPESRPSRASTRGQMDRPCGQYRISLAQANGTLTRHGIGIYREGDRLFMEITGPATWPKHVLTPPVQDELVPESENVFFERLSGVRIVFSRDARGNITSFSGRYRDREFSYVKISDQPPKVPGPPKPSIAIRLDSKHLDVLAGVYIFSPNGAYPKGLRLTIWREGEKLIGQFSGENALQGAFDVYPASETDFFITIDGSHLTFRKNDKGVVTAITYHQGGKADLRGHRI